MELTRLGEKTYYIKNNTNIGIYKINDEEVYIIDTGNDKDCGKKILKVLEENNLKVKGIINTHSNSDHIGGNEVIEKRTGAIVLTHGIEVAFTKYPILEPSFLYGAKPFHDLENKFLMAKPSDAIDLENNLPEGLEYFSLKGHFFDMIGIKTSDDVYFLGDALFSSETINKYHLFFIYDVLEYLNTLEFLKTLNGKYYVFSHVELKENIKDLIEININKIKEISDNILKICKDKKTIEDIEKEIFDYYHLTMNLNQYVLVGSTIKAYLSYLITKEKMEYIIENNKLYFKTCN